MQKGRVKNNSTKGGTAMDTNAKEKCRDGVVGGIDIGSTTTKVLLLGLDQKVAAVSVVSTGANVKRAISNALDQALTQRGLAMEDVKSWVSTGYGRDLVPFAQSQVTEISCHAKGVNVLYPQAKTIIDIGGQDSKVISVNESGNVKNFVMNDKCAAGTGKFLEVIARAMEIEIDEMPDYAQRSEVFLEVSSVCTVFAESEVISLFSQGYDKADIIAAIYRSIARRVRGLANQIGVVPPVVMTGGGAKNKGLVNAFQEALGLPITVPDDPQIIGALGAAHLALQKNCSCTE